MAERKLRNRRKKASLGRVIRVSDAVYATLDSARRGRSWDWYFRKMLGLPDRAGNEQPLVEGLVEVLSRKFFVKDGKTWASLEQDAYETGFIAAARTKQTRVPKPIRVRELP